MGRKPLKHSSSTATKKVPPTTQTAAIKIVHAIDAFSGDYLTFAVSRTENVEEFKIRLRKELKITDSYDIVLFNNFNRNIDKMERPILDQRGLNHGALLFMVYELGTQLPQGYEKQYLDLLSSFIKKKRKFVPSGSEFEIELPELDISGYNPSSNWETLSPAVTTDDRSSEIGMAERSYSAEGIVVLRGRFGDCLCETCLKRTIEMKQENFRKKWGVSFFSLTYNEVLGRNIKTGTECKYKKTD